MRDYHSARSRAYREIVTGANQMDGYRIDVMALRLALLTTFAQHVPHTEPDEMPEREQATTAPSR